MRVLVTEYSLLYVSRKDMFMDSLMISDEARIMKIMDDDIEEISVLLNLFVEIISLACVENKEVWNKMEYEFEINAIRFYNDKTKSPLPSIKPKIDGLCNTYDNILEGSQLESLIPAFRSSLACIAFTTALLYAGYDKKTINGYINEIILESGSNEPEGICRVFSRSIKFVMVKNALTSVQILDPRDYDIRITVYHLITNLLKNLPRL